MTATKETGSARVYRKLRDDILRVSLAPGATLDEVNLSLRFKLSRSPIREALVRLSGEGLVQILPNRSVIVTPMEFDRMPEYLDALDLLQRVVTRLAALNRTEKELAAMTAAANKFEDFAKTAIETGDSIEMIEKNYDFHMAIAAASGNSYFTESYSRLLQEGRRMLFYHFQFQTAEQPIDLDTLASPHRDMLAAIRAGDADRAEHEAHLHSQQFRGRFMSFLNRNLTAKLKLDYSGKS